MSARLYFKLLGIGAGLFLFLFLFLSYFNRLAADDFYYLGGYSEKGIWRCMTDLYSGYSARWTAYLLTGLIVSLHSFKYYLFVFNSITLLALLASIYCLIKNIFQRTLKVELSSGLSLLYTIILASCFFLGSYSIAETWFWLVQVCTYLWSIIFSLILINLFMAEKFNSVHICTLIIAALFIGGASESFALVNIFMLTSYVVLSYLEKKGRIHIDFPVGSITNKKIYVALIFLLISFTITMMAPGNEIRYGALPQVSINQSIWIQIKSFIKVVFIRVPLKLPFLLAFSFPWLILGNYLSVSIAKRKLMMVLKSVKNYFFVWLILIFVFLIPTSFVMSELGPDRALSQITFLIAFCFAALFYFIGYNTSINKKILNTLKPVSVFFIVGILMFHIIQQYPVAKKYAAAYDQRMNLLSDLNKTKQNKSIKIDSLPNSGMIYSAEISTDTGYFTNNFLEYALHLKFNVSRK